jgi:DNA-binding transcriptional ArsR family regulator
MAPDLLTRIRAEIHARMRELQPLVEEHERLLAYAEADARPPVSRGSTRTATPARPRKRTAAAPPREPAGSTQQAIVAALEHGSHTVSELAVVTAISGPSIRQGLRRLLAAGTVTRLKREGRAAYGLSGARR